MALDVDPPPAPELERGVDTGSTADQGNDREYHRAELEEFLADGAWDRGFSEWAEHTALEAEEFQIATDLGLFQQYDFFWDDFAGRVGFHAPGIPEDWRERDLHHALDSWGAVSNVNASLTELGRTVADLLTDEYVDWDEEFEAPEDLPEF